MTPGRTPDLSVPFIDMGAIHAPMVDELRDAFARVLSAADFVIGEEARAFEAELAERVGVAHARGVNNGTAAISLALEAAGIGPGDEVLFPTNSFYATAGAVKAIGARPVPVDVEAATALIDLDHAATRVTQRTAAIVVVHLYGNSVDMDRARAFADHHGLFLLEDAAQAIGGSWAHRPVGALGDAAAFSFYPTKNLGALGQGGAVTTDDRALAERVSLLREHGEAERNHHVIWGRNERIDGMQAAFLRVKLARLDDAQRQRDEAARQYHEQLADVPGVTTFDIAPAAHHVHHLMVVQAERRDDVRQLLADAGVGTGIHYPVPIHRQPAFVETEGEHSLPVAERLADRIVSLPIYPGLTAEQVAMVVEAIRTAVVESGEASLDGAHDVA